jgi:hypothetical protein
MDDKVIAFLQMPANNSANGSRLLVINRKTSAVVANMNVSDFMNNFYPSTMMALNVERLARPVKRLHSIFSAF